MTLGHNIMQRHHIVLQNILHIQCECEKYSSEYCRSRPQNTVMALNYVMGLVEMSFVSNKLLNIAIPYSIANP